MMKMDYSEPASTVSREKTSFVTTNMKFYFQ